MSLLEGVVWTYFSVNNFYVQVKMFIFLNVCFLASYKNNLVPFMLTVASIFYTCDYSV